MTLCSVTELPAARVRRGAGGVVVAAVRGNEESQKLIKKWDMERITREATARGRRIREEAAARARRVA